MRPSRVREHDPRVIPALVDCMRRGGHKWEGHEKKHCRRCGTSEEMFRNLLTAQERVDETVKQAKENSDAVA